jgi:hypothetical protein
MMSEQGLERQHRKWNHFDTLYRTIGDVQERLRTTMKQSHLESMVRTIIYVKGHSV